MIICIICKSVGNYYTNSDSIGTVATSITNQIPLTCWWYGDFGKKMAEEIIFPNPEEQIIMIRTESDASPLEEM